MAFKSLILIGDATMGTQGVFDTTKELIIIPKAFYKIKICDDVIFASQDCDKKKYTHIFDHEGKCLLEADEIEVKSNGWLKVTRAEKQGAYTRNGEVMVPVQFDFVELYVEWNWPPLTDVPKYFEVRNYSDEGKILVGLFRARKKLIIPVEYDRVYISEGYIWVKKEEKRAVFSRVGKNIVPLDVYEYLVQMNHIFEVKKNGKYGAYSSKGQILDYAYDSIWIDARKNGVWIRIEVNGCFGVSTKGGVIIVQPEYSVLHIHEKYIVGHKDGEWKVVYQIKCD